MLRRFRMDIIISMWDECELSICTERYSLYRTVFWYCVRHGPYAKFDDLQWQIIGDEFVDNIIGFVKEQTTNWHHNIYMRRFGSRATDAQLLSQNQKPKTNKLCYAF